MRNDYLRGYTKGYAEGFREGVQAGTAVELDRVLRWLYDEIMKANRRDDPPGHRAIHMSAIKRRLEMCEHRGDGR